MFQIKTESFGWSYCL